MLAKFLFNVILKSVSHNDLHHATTSLKISVKANYVIKMLNEASVTEDQYMCLNSIKHNLTGLKDGLNSFQNHSTTLGINCLLQSCEPDFEKIFVFLNELEDFINFCIGNKSFKRGGSFNPDQIKKYAVFSLFHIGKTLGLTHSKKNSPLFQLVYIITELEPKHISEFYSKYKNDSISKMLQSNKICQFVYNPNKLSTMLNMHTWA